MPCFEHLTRDRSATSGLEGEIDRGFGVIGGCLDGPEEPFLFSFHCERGHVGTGGARSRWMAAMVRVNRSPLTATSASWKVMARAWRTTLAPILMSRVYRLVSDQSAISSDRSALCRKTPRL